MTNLEFTVVPGSCKKISLELNDSEEQLTAVLQGFDDLDDVEGLLHRFMTALAELSDERPGALDQLILSGLIADKLDRLPS